MLLRNNIDWFEAVLYILGSIIGKLVPTIIVWFVFIYLWRIYQSTHGQINIQTIAMRIINFHMIPWYTHRCNSTGRHEWTHGTNVRLSDHTAIVRCSSDNKNRSHVQVWLQHVWSGLLFVLVWRKFVCHKPAPLVCWSLGYDLAWVAMNPGLVTTGLCLNNRALWYGDHASWFDDHQQTFWATTYRVWVTKRSNLVTTRIRIAQFLDFNHLDRFVQTYARDQKCVVVVVIRIDVGPSVAQPVG